LNRWFAWSTTSFQPVWASTISQTLSVLPAPLCGFWLAVLLG
jgi:hypothetical protein